MHALVGENGAGKSTLGRIVAGEVSRDGGSMLLAGEPVSFRSPREALERGVAAISQEPAIVPQLTVAENVMLGREPRSRGFLRRRSLAREYAALAATAGFELPGDMSAGRLRTAEQQKVEILRALSRNAELIVMDEPSAALSEHETRQLHEIIRSLARAGTSILLISHFLREVLDLADTVTVLRDGEVVRTAPTSVGDRVVADRGDARQAADVDVPSEAVPRERLGRPALGARAVRSRRVGRDIRSARGRDPRRGRAGRGGTHRAGPCPLRRRARAVGNGGARDRGGARPEPAPQPCGRPRDDPRVPQGRWPDLRPLGGRERDALATRRRERIRRRAPRARVEDRARRARSLRRPWGALRRARCARSREAISRRCCSPGHSCASRA